MRENTSIRILHQMIRSYLQWSWIIFLCAAMVLVGIFSEITTASLKEKTEFWAEILEKRLAQTEKLLGDGSEFPFALSVTALKIDPGGRIITAFPRDLAGNDIKTCDSFDKLSLLEEGESRITFHPDPLDGVLRLYFVKRFPDFFIAATFDPDDFLAAPAPPGTNLLLGENGLIVYATNPKRIGEHVDSSLFTFRSGHLYLSRGAPLSGSGGMNLILVQEISRPFYFILAAFLVFLLIFRQIRIKNRNISRDLDVLHREHRFLTGRVEALSDISFLQEKEIAEQLDRLVSSFEISQDSIRDTSFLFVENRQYLLLLEHFIRSILKLMTKIRNDAAVLKESEKRFQIALEGINDGIWDFRPRAGELYYSPGWFTMLGYEPDEFPHTYETWANLLHPDDRPGVETRVREFIEKREEFYTIEFRMIAKGGEWRWINARGKVIERDADGNTERMVGTHTDITDRKNNDDELRSLRNLMSNIIDSMPSMLMAVSPDGRVTQWNREVEKGTGIEAEDAHGRVLVDLFPRLSHLVKNVDKAIMEGKTIKLEKVRGLPCGGQFSDITIYPLGGNGVEGAVIRIDDVSERVRLEEVMIQTEKMMSVGGLAAGMAHEINNPLAAIVQSTQVIINRIIEDLPKNIEAAKSCGTSLAALRAYMECRGILRMLDSVLDSGRRAGKIVDNMLSFSRQGKSVLRPYNIPQLLDRTVKLAENDYDLKKKFDFRQILIEREYEENIPDVLCEGSKIQQVFLNILKNGAQAMAVKRNAESRFKLRVVTDGAMVRIEIEDNGPGMNEDIRKRIFEPFYTTKEVGLGLSVSYFIITKNHGGTLTVESRPNKGAKFIIRLPLPQPSRHHGSAGRDLSHPGFGDA